MPNYNVNFSNVWQNLTPLNKQLSRYLAWGKVLVYPLQWLHSRFFLDYKEGTIYLDWNNATAYSKNSFVRYTNKSIYCSIQDTPVGINPLDVRYWYKTQDNFIGLTERMKYTSQLISFEYALNRWFDITFVQPPSVNTIFIINNNIDVNSFLVSSDDINSSYAANEGLQALQFVGENYTNTVTYSFTICYPVGLPVTLGISDSTLRQQISIIADKLKISGTNYNIISI